MPDLLTALLGAAIIALASYLFARWLGRVRVERIRNSNTTDFDVFHHLCTLNIPADELEPKGEMARYLDEGEEDRRNRKASEVVFEDYFALAKVRDTGVGIINSTIYPQKQLCFINYLGTVTGLPSGPRTDAKPLLRALRKYLRRVRCAGVVYEIDCPGPHLSRDQNSDRHAKARRFIQAAEEIGCLTFELPVPYVQPELSLLEGQVYEEVPMSLMYVSLDGDARTALTREDVVEIVNVTLLDWYLDIYDREGELRERYRKRLTEVRDKLLATVPAQLAVQPVTRNWRPPMRDGASSPDLPVGLSEPRKRKWRRRSAAL